MRTVIAALCAALLLAAPAAAQEAAPVAASDEAADAPKAWPVKIGGRRTTGTGGYKGRSGYVQVGSEWRLRASYTDYTFDGTTTTTRTGSLRASYQGEQLSLGLNASVTPRAEEYRNRAFGAEAGWVFLPADEAALIEEWELNGWWSQTRHHQSVPATLLIPVQRELIINQNDLGLGMSVTALKTTLSLDGSVSLYDQDYFDELNRALRRRPRLSAAASLVNGFPRSNASARLDVEAAKWVTPYVSYARTTFRVGGQPVAHAYGVGGNFRYGPAGLEVGFERSKQRGSPDNSYLSLGGSVKF